MNKAISNSIIACFLVYTLFLSNFAFVAGESFLDNDSIVEKINESVSILGTDLENSTSNFNNFSGNESNSSFEITKNFSNETEKSENLFENLSANHDDLKFNGSSINGSENSSEIIYFNNTQNFSEFEGNSSFNSEGGNFSKKITENFSVPLVVENETLSNISNLTEENFEVEIIQLPAKVGENVHWIKRVYGVSENFEIEIPKNAERVIQNAKNLMDSEFKNYSEIRYETSAPKIQEKIFENKKEVLIYSKQHYENVTAKTEIDFNLSVNESEKLKVYWKEEKRYLDFEVFDYDSDGFVDSVEWVIPHLSNQTFEIYVEVLTVQSYPIVGKEWEVEFETSGRANLTIKGINGTFFGKDLDFLELRCGNREIEYLKIENGIFVEDYFCEDISFEISKVLTSGKHDLEFKFGDSVGYAHNYAGKVGYKTQSGVYNFAGLDEFIPLDYSVNVSSAFVIAPNLMNQENVTPSTGGDSGTNSDDSFVSLYLYNSTHIRAQRSASDDGPVVVTWQVLESMDGEFSVQRGQRHYSGSSAEFNETINSPVNIDNSMSWFYINTSYTSNDGDKIQFYSDLVDNDTLKFEREHSGVSTDITFRWVVIEWNLEKINYFLKGYTGEITGDQNSPDCYLLDSSINKSSSILFHQSHAINDGDGGLDSSTRAGYIQDDDQVCFYDYDGSFTAGVKWYLVDFIGTTQREEDIYSSWGSTDYRDDVSFLNNYDVDNSLFWLSATSNGDGTAKPRHTQWWEFNSTGFNVERTYGGQDREYSWQILELPYYENIDVPQFSNFLVNQSYAKENEMVKFSVDVSDSSNNIDSVLGTVDGINVSFIQGSLDEWYYDYQCISEKGANLTFVYASDDGYPIGTNSTGVLGVGVACDLTPPVVNFVSPNTPLNDSSQGKDFFVINVSVLEDNFENITYNLYDSIGLINSTGFSNFVDSIVFTSLPTENYFYNVTVYDKAGNYEFTETREIYIDSENPLIEYVGNTEEEEAIISGNSIEVGVSVIEDNEANITFYLYDEFGFLERTPVPYTDGRRNIVWSLLDDGLYYYNVTVYDDFGHVNSTETRNITLDNVQPVVDYGGRVEENDSYFSRDWIFVNVSYSEEYFKNITFDLYNESNLIDKNSFTDATKDYNFTGLNDGSYWYNVTVCDSANNCGYSLTNKLTLDSVNPVVGFGIGTEADNNNVSRNWIYVNSSIIEDNFENITFNLFDEFGLVNKTVHVSKFNINFTSLSTGFYEYNFSVYDKAGNFGNSGTRTIGVDVGGPDITIDSPQSKAYGNGTDMDLIYSVIDSIAGVDSCWYNLDEGSNVSVDCESSSTFTVSDGSHSLYFYSNDSFGNLAIEEVNFLISTTGPAVTLNQPENDTFYSSSTNTFFNYSVSDLDGVKSCSLFGDFNGTWILNQTDFSFGEIWNDSDMDCSSSTSVSCGEPESGVPFDGCDSSYSTAYEYVSGVQLSDTIAIANSEVTVSCDFVLDGSNDDIYIWHYDGTSWEELKSEIGTTTTTHEVSFNVGENVGNHVVRCGVTYYGDTSDDSCANGGGNYYDNDDLNFSVVEPKEEGNFTLNLSSEGNYFWNVLCNDSLSYVGRALNNYTLGIDYTNPVVSFGEGTVANGERVASNQIYINASFTESNFENITFYLFDSDNLSIKNKSYFVETVDYTFTSLEDGFYYYNVTVYDKSGRFGVSETRGIELDVSLPSGNLNSPSDNYFTKDKSHNFTADVEDSVELKDATLFIFNSTGQLIYSYLVNLAGLTYATIGVVYEFLNDG
ncbi:MAG TPA: hypothetical protein VJ895_02360, partial [Candidatus Nanoarchaeia archaeon]|nr:hypothetical protein [Candidatus Nanoarchaeia archaeon]